MDTVIDLARKLGMAIRDDERAKRVDAATLAYETDAELQQRLSEYNVHRVNMQQMLQKDQAEQDAALIKSIGDRIKILYREVVDHPVYQEYTAARAEMDKMVSEINGILNFFITGEEQSGGCSASQCASCGMGCQGHGH